VDPRTTALLSALHALPPESAEFVFGGRTRVFGGVTLYAYAVAAGLVTGQVREELATTYLVVTAEDGARAALSLAEVSPILSNATVLLAYEQDGEALRIGVRLVVPREGGRSLVGVVGIEIHDVTDDPAPEHAVAGSLDVRGLLPRPGARDLRDVAQNELVEVETATEWDREHGGVARRYSGVPVQRLLSDAGMFLMADGDALLSRVIVATGADGRRAVLAAGECGPRFTATPAIVAVQRDGVPLSAEEGPARLVVPYDRGPDRRVRNLVSLEAREG
jgi:hypothetical protein